MAWLTEATAENEVIVERRKYKERWTYLSSPPSTIERTITTTTYHYRGISASFADAVVDAAQAEENVIEAYFEYGDGGGGHLVKTVQEVTGWTAV